VTEPEEDREGDALAAEIAADKAREAERRRRWLLYLPPIASLCVAAVALALARPRAVAGARAIVGGRPPAGSPLSFRTVVLRAVPGDEAPTPLPRMEVRIRGSSATARAQMTDDDGAAEIVVDPPLPPRIELEGRQQSDPWIRLAAVELASLPVPDPRDGVIAAKRNGGSGSGDLQVDAAPEKGALAPPLRGAAWVRVRRAGLPVVGARVEISAEAGVTTEIVPAYTDVAGLARVEIVPDAPPVILSVKATKDTLSGTWRGAFGEVMGVPVPSGDGRIAGDTKVIELLATSSRPRAYVDLWKDGVRIAGGALKFERGPSDKGTGVAWFTVPAGVTGVCDLEVSSSPNPSSTEDLIHATSWPIVIASDAVDAWGALATSPRVEDRVALPGASLSAYPAVVAATIARAPIAVPKREIVADGLKGALQREGVRVKNVRRAATFAILGGGLVELGLMIFLGVFTRPIAVEDELAAIEGGTVAKRAPTSRRFVALVVMAVGIVALIFAGLAIMAWGMPS